MPGVLFVGAGREQRPAIVQARQRGLHVVAVDSDASAEGLAYADVSEVADVRDTAAVEAVARRHGVDGVLTVGVRSLRPVAAHVSKRLGLPSIGPRVAHRLAHKLAARRTLAEEGLPQPAFAAVRTLAEGRAAIATVGLPAVLKPVDADGQRGLFRIADAGDLESHLHAALAESPAREALLERLVEGDEMNAVVVARGGAPQLVALCDRHTAPGAFGVAVAHVHPAGIHSDRLAAVERLAERTVSALGLAGGVALVQLVATRDGGAAVLTADAAPGGPLTALVRHAVGVDLVELALRFALGEEVPDDVALPRFSRPAVLRFLAAEPGGLRPGRVTRVGALGPVLAADGVLDAQLDVRDGSTIAPLARAADRCGFVLATGDTTLDARAHADAAAALAVVEVE